MNLRALMTLTLLLSIFTGGCAALRGAAAASRVEEQMLNDYTFSMTPEEGHVAAMEHIASEGYGITNETPNAIYGERLGDDNLTKKITAIIKDLGEGELSIKFMQGGKTRGTNNKIVSLSGEDTQLKKSFIEQIDPEYIENMKEQMEAARLKAKMKE